MRDNDRKEEDQTIHIKVEDNGKNLPITLEFEQVTIKVPKLIMDFLRQTDVDNKGPADWIETKVVEAVQSYLEAVEPPELRDWFKLGPVFKKILGNDECMR